ncbi:GMP synthase [Drepanopeziza brunnea f. sp. 'multigermtubi' MB_m1]|uniref:GMP synthase n=1 Tax=Marssonina brunnea f. sp. multigermtubi (strain MB_m1) TaxID=1072389 RepID=K1WHX7_MARBU|nr:GMP synthase [Drepanopeziza brunnea f. sp. 'multigermtubi' MB_m1]EKD11812.1 GMP synthase [Drepanopeziza brunnea f. sp. 'multigermtubi' MB_m1]
MPDFKAISKSGWHPKGKDGKSKESWRGDFKGIDQIGKLLGREKKNGGADDEHTSRPLHQLKDPSAFGPPPKNVNYHGGAALPNQITPHTGGWGAPLSKESIAAKEAEEEEAAREAEEAETRKGPPLPYRSNTTGLSTSHLPPPPGRKDGADGRPPGLPPRLPPRQNSNTLPSPSPPPSYTSKDAIPEPDAHRGILNQGALDRLGSAGVSIPGFGIGGGKAKTPLPPPNLSRSPAPSPAPASNSQLNELQSRFSRMSSSSSPKAEVPSEGTTFAQKQAALKTASSFRNDPSSVSLSDARMAASTANNFRERHGEQVKSGWQSANKLNAKYGISDKAAAFGASSSQVSQPPSSQIDMRDNTGPPSALEGGSVGKKKPPPPPAKKKELMGRKEPLPPPIPMSTKPKPQSSSSRDRPVDLDLDLQSLWFVDGKFPPSTINTRIYSSTSGWESSGSRKKHYKVIHMRFPDLSSSKIRITWDSSNPGYTVKAEQRHTPPPRPLSRQELEDCRAKYSDSIAAWCESKMGQQVGNGECWTLANEALKAVAQQCTSRGQEPCTASQELVHGHILYTYRPAISLKPEPAGGILAAGVARGDIIQILSARFESPNGSFQVAGQPDHTAVITGVEPNGVLRVVQQNTGGVKRVVTGNYNMSELTTGEVRIFRAVGINWLGELKAEW